MSQRDYQHDFASTHQAMYESDERQRKAHTLLVVLRAALGERVSRARVLNVGCSTGYMDSFIAPHVGELRGIDIDEAAVRYARATHRQPNLVFDTGDAMAIDAPDGAYDVVICSQVYEHVPDAPTLMREIHRVLAADGACYFAATNRLCVIEQHYFLPFLSIVPVWMAHWYLRLAGRGRHYYERHLTYWGLKKLVGGFALDDYTRQLLHQPARFGTEYMVGSSGAKPRLIRLLARLAYWAFPGYVWILRPK